MRARRQPLPLLPLLRSYAEAGIRPAEELARVPGLGARFRAVLAARDTFLSEAFLEGAAESEFQATLLRFYEACVQPPLHGEALRRRSGILRHALNHILRC